MAQNIGPGSPHVARLREHRLRVHAAAARIAQEAEQAVAAHHANLKAQTPASGPAGPVKEAPNVQPRN